MDESAAHIKFGDCGEDVATSIMRQQGFTVLERNWRYGHLEIDLICEKDNLIVFVEVKTRRSNRLGGPLGAITKAKKRNLINAAQAWIKSRNAWSKPCRIDVICLVGGKESFHMEHIPNAIDLSTIMGGGNAAW